MDCELCVWIWLDNCWWLGQVTALRCGQGQQMRNYVEWDWDVLCRQRGTNGSRGQCEQVNKCQSGRAEHRLIGAAWIAVMRNAGIQWSTEHYQRIAACITGLIPPSLSPGDIRVSLRSKQIGRSSNKAQLNNSSRRCSQNATGWAGWLSLTLS